MSDFSPTKAYRSGPIVKREHAELFDEAWVGGRYVKVPFERDIVWIRTSRATVLLRHKGNEVRELIALHDIHFYFLTAPRTAIRTDVWRAVRDYGIEPGDALTVDVDIVVSDEPLCEIPPKHPAYEPPKEDRATAYFEPRYDHRWRRRSNEERVVAVTVHEEQAVWSSARHLSVPEGVIPADVEKVLAELERAAAELAAKAKGT